MQAKLAIVHIAKRRYEPTLSSANIAGLRLLLRRSRTKAFVHTVRSKYTLRQSNANIAGPISAVKSLQSANAVNQYLLEVSIFSRIRIVLDSVIGSGTVFERTGKVKSHF